MAIRVVIDTNIWVSSLLNPYGFPATLRKYFEKGAFQTIISEPILEELAEVLTRPKIKDKRQLHASGSLCFIYLDTIRSLLLVSYH